MLFSLMACRPSFSKKLAPLGFSPRFPAPLDVPFETQPPEFPCVHMMQLLPSKQSPVSFFPSDGSFCLLLVDNLHGRPVFTKFTPMDGKIEAVPFPSVTLPFPEFDRRSFFFPSCLVSSHFFAFFTMVRTFLPRLLLLHPPSSLVLLPLYGCLSPCMCWTGVRSLGADAHLIGFSFGPDLPSVFQAPLGSCTHALKTKEFCQFSLRKRSDLYGFLCNTPPFSWSLLFQCSFLDYT